MPPSRGLWCSAGERQSSKGQSVFHAQDVLVPHRTGQGPAIADIEGTVFAEIEAASQLGVDNRVAGGVLDAHVRGNARGELLASDYGPADEFRNGRKAKVPRVVNLIAQANAIPDDVAREVGAVNRNP